LLSLTFQDTIPTLKAKILQDSQLHLLSFYTFPLKPFSKANAKDLIFSLSGLKDQRIALSFSQKEPYFWAFSLKFPSFRQDGHHLYQKLTLSLAQKESLQ